MRFAFIVHPLSKRDITNHRKYRWLKPLPLWLIELLLLFKGPKVVGRTDPIFPRGEKISGKGIDGCWVGLPMTPRMLRLMPDRFITARLAKAVRLSRQEGARVVGLGALTACVGDCGVTLNKLDIVPVTTGNSLTVAMAIEAAERLTDDLYRHLKPEQRVLGVVGATGSIGQACTELLAKQFGHVILVVRDKEKGMAAAKKAGLFDRSFMITDNPIHLHEAHVVVTVTSAETAVIEPDHIAYGTLVIDVARPRDVSEQMKDRPDVLVIEGGVVRVPGTPELGLDFGFGPGNAYACMAETMLGALEGLENGGKYRAFTVGKDVTAKMVEAIGFQAVTHGFTLAGYRSFEREVRDSDIEDFRQFAKQRQAWFYAPAPTA